MRVRRRWALMACGLVAGGLIGAIPAFVPEGHDKVAATAAGGQQLRFYRTQLPDVGEVTCFKLEPGGGGTCRSGGFVVSGSEAALLGVTYDRRGVGWWGVVGDDISAVRVVYQDSSAREFSVATSFVVFGGHENPPTRLYALDRQGRSRSSLDEGMAITRQKCTDEACSSVQVSDG
jgi:hypothetical protein